MMNLKKICNKLYPLAFHHPKTLSLTFNESDGFIRFIVISTCNPDSKGHIPPPLPFFGYVTMDVNYFKHALMFFLRVFFKKPQ
jgi:hypothetical protein